MTPPNGPQQDSPSAGKETVPVAAPWSDTLGQTASRCAQILLVAAVFVGVVWLLLRVSVVVIAALVALILASAVYPLVKWLTRKGWSSLLATGAAFVGILALLSGVVTGIVFAVRSEWDELSASAVEGWQELQRFLMAGPLPVDTAAVDAALQRATGLVTSGTFVDSALTGITAATEFVTGAVLMIVILFFFLKDGPKMWNFTLRWFRGETRARLAESGDRTIQILGGYVRGTAIIAAVDAVFIGIPLALLGVPLALPLAVIVFVGGFLPIVGATIAGVLAALVALVTNGLVVALIVVAIVIAVNQIEGDLLQPVVMGRTLSLHAVVVLLALSVGTIVGGIFGAILAVPLTAVAWAVIQVWTDAYQIGDDPVLGEDPLDPKDRVESKASMAERWKYQQMRYQRRFNRKRQPARKDAAGRGGRG
ncbi:AI-2E family transporter [Corynebacterium halotolerans]|uniref:Permease n=1 Tax=Corynebacterium halotolerans YIM 70093 = DSM 44683 TaxID=1121362 RepID=M1NIE6_9CORY|nr:AI-2E family transporter [Corynebacterium halotolerans]AGF71188.1 permease [Corynebacterium halotolerans YIM 70093 = DSM 44683]